MDLVNRYSQLVNLPVREKLYDADGTRYFEISVGNLNIKINEVFQAGVTKKVLKKKACELFVNEYADEINKIFLPKQGFDYIQYSRTHLLNGIEVYMNVPITLKPTIISFDSEGIPPSLVQICTSDHTVYLFTDLEMCKPILQDDNIVKIVCDGTSERRHFDKLVNLVDIQESSKKSLVRCIYEVFDVNLIKNKSIHIRGWNVPLSKSQMDYAIADALWIWKIYHAKINDKRVV